MREKLRLAEFRKFGVRFCWATAVKSQDELVTMSKYITCPCINIARERQRQMQRDKCWWPTTAHLIIAHRHSVDSMALPQAASASKWKFIWFRPFISAQVRVCLFQWWRALPSFTCDDRRQRRVVPKPLKFILYKMQRSRRCTIKIAPYTVKCRCSA